MRSRIGTPTVFCEYAQKFRSDREEERPVLGCKEGEKQSPLGPLFADAQEEGYSGKSTVATRSLLRVLLPNLKGQGKNAPGGAYDYMVKGKMIGGFALVAYPAKYAIFRHHDLYCESRRSGLSEGPGPEHREGGSGHEAF